MTMRWKALLLLGLMVGVSASASSTPPGGSTGQTRTYYITADEVTWDYAPGGINQITGRPFGDAESLWVASGPEGAPYQDSSGEEGKKGTVPPGGTHTYIWPVPERAGPAHGDMSSVLWMYHSHVSEIADVNAGLIGPMIITARGMAKADGTPKDVDREFVVAFASVEETESPYLQENIQQYMGDPKSVKVVSDPFGRPVMVSGDPTQQEMNYSC